MSRKRIGRKIFCINDAKSYNSITEAAVYYDIARSSISKQLMGIRPQAAGKYFVYIDDEITEEQLNSLRIEMLEKIYGIKNL